MSGEITVGVYTNQKETMTRDLFPVLEHFNFRFRTLDRDQLAELNSGDIEVLLLPGGWYFFKDEQPIADAIRNFAKAGGGCIGVCCGQINLCQLGLIEADLINQRILGPCIINVVDENHPIVQGVRRDHINPDGSSKIDILCYNGWPMLLPPDGKSVMIASYDADKKVAAIAGAQYGNGRVVAFSPHPEGATCAPGIFRDRDSLPLVYDGIAMGTALLLKNAIEWCAPTS
jgi:glutamine amidotransferase-like uncharacterized protein